MVGSEASEARSRGRGWGVVRRVLALVPALSPLKHPPTPDPSPPLARGEGSRNQAREPGRLHLRGRLMQRPVIMQHQGELVQWRIAKAFRLDRLYCRQNIFAVDAGLTMSLQDVTELLGQ